MNWEECNFKRFVKKSKFDRELINSLKKTSENKLIMDSFSPINEKTVASKFVVNYDSLREILEALALSKEIKIYNHECFSSFIREILLMENESLIFDKLRKIRNFINYYGKDISVEQGSLLIKDTKYLRTKFLKLLNEN